MKNESENKQCAITFNNVLYELLESGKSNNAIANGLLFTLCIHILNSNFKEKEIIEQLKKLLTNIKKEIDFNGDNDKFVIHDKPISDDWH